MLKNFLYKWKNHFNSKERIINFVLTFFVLILLLQFMADFLLYIEARSGFSFQDPILSLFAPIDVTFLLFALMYGMLGLAFFLKISRPDELLLLARAFILVFIFRIIGMYTLPLEPPATMIALQDPLIEYFGTDKTLTKDLFFSGHTSSSFLLFLSMRNKYFKILFMIFTISIGIMVLLQHVHYTVDVIAAPFFAFASYKLSEKIGELY